MNWFDVVILAVLALSVLVGIMRGLVAEMLSLGIWVVAFLAARAFGPQLGDYFRTAIAAPGVRLFAGYVSCFVAVMILGAVARLIISRMLYTIGLSGIDRLLGMGFGFMRGVLLMAFVIFLLDLLPYSPQVWSGGSQLVPRFQPVASWLGAQIPRIRPPAGLTDHLPKMSELLPHTMPSMGSLSMPSANSLNLKNISGQGLPSLQKTLQEHSLQTLSDTPFSHALADPSTTTVPAPSSTSD